MTNNLSRYIIDKMEQTQAGITCSRRLEMVPAGRGTYFITDEANTPLLH